ncbi:MAG TPA: caspase family protein [Bryobacteraceae bacterium]|nr:caspase family protein [Bryobacteraceae bacterium]
MKYSALFICLSGAVCAVAQSDPSGSGGLDIRLTRVTLSRICSPVFTGYRPVAEAEFLTTDPSVCVLVVWNGGHTGDKIRFDWQNPLGTVMQTYTGTHAHDDSGSHGWYRVLDIADHTPAFAPGDWRVRIYWNDMGIAEVPFRIVVPPSGPVQWAGSTTLPAGTVGVSYTYQFKLRGGESSNEWSVSGLPLGLALSNQGMLTGTPSQRGTYLFTVTARDRAGNSISRKIAIGVAPSSEARPVVQSLQVSRSASGCAQGPNVTEFHRTQPDIWLEFLMNKENKGDDEDIEWLDPTGEIIVHSTYQQRGETAGCNYWRLGLSRVPEALPGTWRVRVRLNQSEVFSIPFRVTGPEVTTSPTKLPARWALLIGNTRYQHLPAIPSAVEDVDLLSEVLRTDGFDVTTKLNLSVEELRRTERDFLSKVQKGGVVVVYFSGYGIHQGSENWLTPIDFDGRDARPLSTKAYSVLRLRQLLEEKDVRLKIFFLNAARAVPGLLSQAWRAGLAAPVVDKHTVLCLSEPPGRTEDVTPTEKASSFARMLADVLQRHNVGLKDLLTVELPKTAEAMGTSAERPSTFLQDPEDFNFRR